MKHRNRNILILVAVLACIGAAVYFIVPPGQKTHLGLDLQGGLEVVFQAKTTAGKVPTADEMTQTLAIMNKRVNGLGVSESQVQQQGADKISVALPGVTNAEQALAIIGKTAQLVFFDDYTTRIIGPLGSEAQLWQQASGRIPKKDLAQLKAGKMPMQTIAGATVPKYRIVTADPGMWGNNKQKLYFLYTNKPAMTGAAIQSAHQSFDQFNRPNVVMNFTSKGAQQFEKVTKELAIRGSLQGESQTFAIVLDDLMESDPQVDYREYPQGISGDSAEITGSFTVQEAKDLALVLNTGALPVTLDPIEKQQVSATLGADSLRAGLIAGAVGMILVLIFMVVVYRFLGVIADIALIIYAVLLWGVFNAVPVTLTLPGIAGMILTIGVAADANVVVFERIKEEVRLGKSVRSAVNSGYGKGIRTILDANALILLTALVLFYFATAQPKGFALTLMIGTVVSLFTAVLATRAMLGLLVGFSWFEKAEFMGAHPGEQLFEGEFALSQTGTDRPRPAARPTGSRRARQARPAAAAAGADGGTASAEVVPEGEGPLPEEADGAEAPDVAPATSQARSAGARQTGSRTSRGQRPRKKKRNR
jgi:protein-export membrane protein SecD